MSQLDIKAFQPLINSSSPSFNSSALGTTSHFYALESTALNRIWQGPMSRSVRVISLGSLSFYVQFGSTLASAGSTDSMLVIGEGVFSVSPSDTNIAVTSSTSAVVNITLGTGR